MGFLGGIGKALGKVASFAAPIVSMVNPLAGAALGFAGNLASGKSLTQSLFSAASSLIPGGGGGAGVFGNLLGKFGGAAGFLDGAGGNSILSSALNLATGKKGVTDVLGQLMGNFAQKGLSQLGLNNATELAAQRMAQMLLQ
ncbi:hypothetical protein [Cystobacter ferrugineus]|uniref:Uncharacterized protein n=1 Tax=Cystobacter ferrugineus TaxID=83449 RepID=A0A1L9B1N4_9BACT|nr:hypothetical protein [Cystobacter ferrugineus]OJH36126.1 hypothetical protein BON30_33705 [Cystobacter ferrugineus]